MKPDRANDRPTDPLEDDPLASAFPVRRSLPAFLFSAVFHVALLVLLATISLAVVPQAQRIFVKLDQKSFDEIAHEDESDLEGAPSLRDLAGVLRPQLARPRATNSVAGPQQQPVSAMRATQMPRISGVGPSVGQTPGTLDVPLSIGGGALAGAMPGGGGFGDLVTGLRKVGIDLVLVIDTTDSMESVLAEVKSEVQDFIANLQQMVPASRVGVVAYRDKGDAYVTKWVDFSFHTDKVQSFVAGLQADGGGDYEEAVKQAMDAAMNELSWRKTAKRIIILIGGTPPHKEDSAELLRMAREFREKYNGAIGTIDVTKRLHQEYEAEWAKHMGWQQAENTPAPEFYKETTQAYQALSGEGGGELLSLGEERALLKQVMILTFGTRWRSELAQYADKLQ
jgi:soluble cytochrome b562